MDSTHAESDINCSVDPTPLQQLVDVSLKDGSKCPRGPTSILRKQQRATFPTQAHWFWKSTALMTIMGAIIRGLVRSLSGMRMLGSEDK